MSAVTVSERDLSGFVADCARLFGWRRYHTWLSRRSPAGFPDEVLVRPPRLVFAELKSDRGRLTPEQGAWTRSEPSPAPRSTSGGRSTPTRLRRHCGE
jgi:hypothetical protein